MITISFQDLDEEELTGKRLLDNQMGNMKPDILPSSPNRGLLGSNKRRFLSDPRESPTASRAKRIKKKRKHQLKEVKDKRSGQQKWSTSDNNPGERDFVVRNQTSDKPAQMMAPDENKTTYRSKTEDEENENWKGRGKNAVANGIKYSRNWAHPSTAGSSPRSFNEASSSKTRTEYRSDEATTYPIDDDVYNISAAANPPSNEIIQQLAYESGELMPRHMLATDHDSAIYAYPNPFYAHPTPAVGTAEEFRRPDCSESTTAATARNSDRAMVPFLDPSQVGKEVHTIASSPIQSTATETTATAMATVPDVSTAPASTKVLRAINKRLKALETSFFADSASKRRPKKYQMIPRKEIKALQTDIARLHERLDCEKLRAAFRHSMLFNSLTKLAGDVGVLSSQVALLLAGDWREQAESDNHHNHHPVDSTADGGQGVGAGIAGVGAGATDVSSRAQLAGNSSRVHKLTKNMQRSRKTLEQCLMRYTEDMNRAESREDVVKYGGLVVQYAGDLFKTFG